MNVLRLLSACALLALPAWLSAGEPAPDPAPASDPLRGIKSETLTYRVLAWKGARVLSMNLGKVTFTLSRDDDHVERQLVLRAEAKGGMTAYPYDAAMTARLRDSDYLEHDADSIRTRPGYKTRKLAFTSQGVDYLKHKHCAVPALCHNPAHFSRADDESEVHCDGCDDPKHYVWHMASRVRCGGRIYDMLAAMYVGRALPVQVDGAPQTIRIVSADELWDIEASAEKEETITVAAGRFDCLKVLLKTLPANDTAKRHVNEFQGPFGLHDSVGIYVDKATRQLVLVRGTADVGTSFQVEVALTERKVEYFDGAGPAKP